MIDGRTLAAKAERRAAPQTRDTVYALARALEEASSAWRALDTMQRVRVSRMLQAKPTAWQHFSPERVLEEPPNSAAANCLHLRGFAGVGYCALAGWSPEAHRLRQQARRHYRPDPVRTPSPLVDFTP